MAVFAVYDGDEIVNIIEAESATVAERVTGKKAVPHDGRVAIGWSRERGGPWRPPKPFESWRWDGDDWVPPVPYPPHVPDTYVEWDEQSQSWHRKRFPNR